MTHPLSCLTLLPLLAGLLLGAVPDAAVSPWDGVPRIVGGTAHDADTIVGATVILPCGVALVNETIRAADFDAWEVSKTRRSVEVTDDEIVRGKAALKDFEILRSQSKRLYGLPVKETRDNYGRLLLRWVVEDANGNRQSVAEWMKQRGHVRQ